MGVRRVQLRGHRSEVKVRRHRIGGWAVGGRRVGDGAFIPGTGLMHPPPPTCRCASCRAHRRSSTRPTLTSRSPSGRGPLQRMQTACRGWDRTALGAARASSADGADPRVLGGLRPRAQETSRSLCTLSHHVALITVTPWPSDCLTVHQNNVHQNSK